MQEAKFLGCRRIARSSVRTLSRGDSLARSATMGNLVRTSRPSRRSARSQLGSSRSDACASWRSHQRIPAAKATITAMAAASTRTTRSMSTLDSLNTLSRRGRRMPVAPTGVPGGQGRSLSRPGTFASLLPYPPTGSLSEAIADHLDAVLASASMPKASSPACHLRSGAGRRYCLAGGCRSNVEAGAAWQA